jgi:hypothetical protein
VLPTWRKVLRLHIGPGSLRASVWRGRRQLAQAELADPSADTLRPGLDALLAMLAQQCTLHGANADVEWADACVTLDVVEGEFADHSQAQLQAVASACVAELLGPTGAAMELRWQLQRDERHLLICAVPRDTLATLEQTLGAHGVRLRSAQPRLCEVWNRHTRRLGKGPAVLALVDATNTTIACLHDGAIAALARSATNAHHTIRCLDAQVNRLQSGLGVSAGDATRYWIVGDRLIESEPLARWTPLAGDAAAATGSHS